MKNIFNKFAFFIALSFVFISCGNLTTSEDDDSIPQGKGKITISTDLQNGRSVLPTAIKEDTTGLTWILSGVKAGESKQIGYWEDDTDKTAYQKMVADTSLLVDTGTWDFTLTASQNNATEKLNVLQAHCNSVQINAGENKLNFVMQEATGDKAATGSIEFTLNFPENVVTKGIATLTPYEGTNPDIQDFTANAGTTNQFLSSITYTKENISAGYYILKIQLQQEGDATTPAVEYINTYSCLIRVAPGLSSIGKYTLPDLAQLYTIKYECNQGSIGNQLTTTSYNAYTSFELPEPTLGGHYFAGWYTRDYTDDGTFTEKFFGNAGDTKTISEDTTLYAKWNKEVTGITHANNTLYISDYEGLCIFRDIVNGSHTDAITIPANESISGASAFVCDAGTSYNYLSVELEKDIKVTDAWIPIGVYSSTPSESRDYTAIFNGNNHTITLSNGIDSTSYAALFVNVKGTIKNLVVEGEINSQRSNAVAGICAYSNGGTFEHCVNKCKINSNTSSGTGGIVGYSNGATIKSCVNMGEISSSLSTIGGIVGATTYSSTVTIENSINLGKITGTSNVSGIFGLGGSSASAQNITDCINIGEIAVTPSDGDSWTYAAGIICSSNSVTVSNCISAGNIINNTSAFVGTAFFGAINYSSDKGTYSNCYYDSSKIINPGDFNVSEINSKTTSELCSLDSSILSNWSKDVSRYPLPNIVATDSSKGISASVWNEICELAKVDTSSSGGSGTASGITFAGYDSTYTTGSPKFYITTAEGLATFRNMVNGTVEGSITILKDGSSTSTSDYIVTSETELSPIYGELISDIELPSDENWIPIGSSENPFLGYFSGNNHTVSNLNINATTDNQGLFGVVEGTANNVWCTITNLVVEGNITSSACNVAGIAGKATLTKFENCVNKATVESKSTASNVAVAGIAGYVTNVEMEYCYNAGSITASSGVAGIAGYETESDNFYEYAYCINSGTITGGTNYSSIIGIANSGLGLSVCANYGEIISTTGNETGCIIGTCMTSGAEITQVSEILSVGKISTNESYYVIANNVSIIYSYYDSNVLSSITVSGLYGYNTETLIDFDCPIEVYEDWYFTPGVYPIPYIEECVSEEIWEEIVAAATPQNSGSSGIVINANVSTFSDLKTKIESVIDTYTLDKPYVIAISDSFGTDLDTASPITVSSHVKLVAATTDGCSISKTDAYASVNIFTVAAGASLTLGDSNADGELIIDGNETLTTTTKSLINVSGTLVLNEKSTLQNNKCKEVYATNGAAVYSDGGTVKILGGTVKNNSNSYKNNTGGAIYIKNGTFEMTAGIVSNNSSYSSGGAIYVDNSTVTISGGTFDMNEASNKDKEYVHGGALYLASCSTVNITGATFNNNFATNPETNSSYIQFHGGAIYIINSGTNDIPARISNCSFNSNTAYQRGGAIYTGGESYINIDSSTFKSNIVKHDTANGSAVYIGNTDGNIIIEGCEFSDNTTSDTIFTVYNDSTGGIHQVNGSELSKGSGYNPN